MIMKLFVKKQTDTIFCVFGDSIQFMYHEHNVAIQCVLHPSIPSSSVLFLKNPAQKEIFTTRYVEGKQEVQINSSVLVSVLDRIIKVANTKPVSLSVTPENITFEIRDEDGAITAEASICYVMTNESTDFSVRELFEDLEKYKYLDIPVDPLVSGLSLCKKTNDMLEISVLTQTHSIKMEAKETMSSTRFFIPFPASTPFFDYCNTFSNSSVGDLESAVSCMKSLGSKFIKGCFDENMILLSNKSKNVVLMIVIGAEITN